MKFDTIRISEITCNELKKLGAVSQTYDSIIQELIKHTTSCGRYWERKN